MNKDIDQEYRFAMGMSALVTSKVTFSMVTNLQMKQYIKAIGMMEQ